MARLLTILLLIAQSSLASPTVKTKFFMLPDMDLDRIYPAMSGPMRRDEIRLDSKSQSPTLWITGFSVEALDQFGKDVTLKHLCHAWARLPQTADDPRGQSLLTVSQGLGAMKFPDGFAVRIPNDGISRIYILAQGLNEDGKPDHHVRFKFNFSYLDEADAKRAGLVPLIVKTVFVRQKDVVASLGSLADKKHNKSHDGTSFDVPPGRHTFRTRFVGANLVKNPETIHFIKMHLHAYGESMELYDETDKQTLWRGSAKTDSTGEVLLSTDSYSSRDGIKIDPQHTYDVITTYNNISNKWVDAMAVFRLYFGD